MPTPTYYTVIEVADFLGIHRNTLQRYLRQGLIKSVRLGTGSRAPYRIPEWAIYEWERRSRSTP